MSRFQEDEQVMGFMDRLAAGNVERDQSWGWNMSSDPCKDKWLGVSCDLESKSVKEVVLHQLNLTGVLDVGSACRASSPENSQQKPAKVNAGNEVKKPFQVTIID
ncbi:hypothetical protein V6N13_109067 [Hibiscus sabdariffa]|uniref:Tudor domain-containing protein n=1 Tax=Hibiscus sabdariffa TaxID=183260 RepID=A0ABR2FP42_9ROSI